jgi:NAD(P)-dependent dehydrogenase (short-subunit alcohol dehydrogenase family)
MSEVTDLSGRVTVVTGAGAKQGLGNSLARVFAGDGAKVVGVDLRDDRGPDIERQIRDAGGDFTYVRGDLRMVSDCERVIQKAIDLHGRIDILVNNAMTNPDPFGPSHDISEELWDNCLDTMLKGTFFCCRYALKAMLAQQSGLILNISSLAAIGAFPRNRAYGAAKAGVLHLSAGLAEEYRSQGIRVHGIIMGAVDSDEFRSQWTKSPRAAAMPAEQRGAFMASMAARTAHPDDVAREISRIAADDTRWHSGDAIQVPGSTAMIAPVGTVMLRATPG